LFIGVEHFGNQSYLRQECIAFRKTKAAYGGLANMAAGFPLLINGIKIRTVEAIYQACRFPLLPDVQAMIIAEASPMAAKMKSRKYLSHTRPDWEQIRVAIMFWCLRVKLLQNWDKFSQLLLSTGNFPLVEESRRDVFWGTKPVDPEILVGHNVLGCLLTELRELLRTQPESLQAVEPLAIPQFLLLGEPIELLPSAES
jgi:ribA/ribD-fused uncharacterized protein